MINEENQIFIVGGGIAGCLLLCAMRAKFPNASVELFEASGQLCGNHTWCFYESDISPNNDWIRPIISKSWSSYAVHFPKFSRKISQKYHAIRSDDLREYVMKNYSQNVKFNSQANVSRFPYNSIVFDCTGWGQVNGSCGFQKFVGLDVTLERKHGLDHVVLMDAQVEQIDGFRFFYVLPWDEKRLLVEDTYYSSDSQLDFDRTVEEIHRYVAKKKWKIKSIQRQESGSLPIYFYPKMIESRDNVFRLGASSGLFNPVTGYTLPPTIFAIDRLCSLGTLSAKNVANVLQEVRISYRPQLSYLGLLARMLFLASAPDQRYRMLQRFYEFREPMIQRLFSMNLNRFDKIRVFLGSPPVSLLSVVNVLLHRDSK